MKSFHPVTVLIFFAAMLTPLMTVNNPVYTAVLLVGAILILLQVRSGRGLLRELWGYLVIFLIMAAMNPLFVHRGSTPLFFLNGRAITLEAVVYGVCSALRLTASIIWCRAFSLVMTSEKLFCITGKLSPKISAMLTMTVRFIPDMLAQGRKINAYSRTSGEFPDDSLLSRFRRIMSVFSALVTWSIESGVQTADSMKARGFELKGRTAYSRFSYHTEDAVLLVLCIASCAAVCTISGRLNAEFYPTVKYSADTAALGAASFLSAAAYVFPTAFAMVIGLKRSRRSLFRKGEK
ncbi:MAG: energy-coupling factor transporter transmembrane protein EcfT [Ruminococcus sp.]|nr:energy-coupling factor transporter transmembrane protein EcfT [Ruminococcus sp.]